MTPKVTYDLIEPNIAEVDVSGAKVSVSWKCPVSGKVVAKSDATMTPTASTPGRAGQAVKRTVLAEGIVGLNRFITSMFGGTAGRVATAATTQLRAGGEQAINKPTFGPAAENAGVVTAFSYVANKFRWDEDRELFVSTDPA